MNSSGFCMSFLGLEACSSLGENRLPNQSWDPPSYRYPSPLHSLKRTTKRSWPAPWQVGLGAKNCPLWNWQQTPPENGWLEDDFPFEMASFQPRTVSFWVRTEQIFITFPACGFFAGVGLGFTARKGSTCFFGKFVFGPNSQSSNIYFWRIVLQQHFLKDLPCSTMPY